MALQAENRGFAAIVAVHLRDEQLLAAARRRVTPLMQQLLERAQAAGVVRPDIVHEDISVLFWTSARVVDATRDIAPEFWRRYLTLVARRPARRRTRRRCRIRRSRRRSTGTRWSASRRSSPAAPSAG